ncbi:MAG: hypothetical protein DWP95_09405 [Proteobacteria bacterium]|nr:MAG: hypothetical protein DWP95_09405 [Pseudomonadota bacterium]
MLKTDKIFVNYLISSLIFLQRKLFLVTTKSSVDWFVRFLMIIPKVDYSIIKANCSHIIS